MQIITGPRGSGKTTALIKMAAETGAYIVVPNQDMAVMTAKLAREMNLKIPFPITYSELMDGKGMYRRGHQYSVLIDDLELFLAHITRPIPIIAATFTPREEVIKLKLPEEVEKKVRRLVEYPFSALERLQQENVNCTCPMDGPVNRFCPVHGTKGTSR